MRKLVTLVVVLAMVMAFMVPTAMAASDGTITLTNAAIGKEYKAYKILDATYVGDAVAYTTTAANRALFAATTDSPWTVSTVADANGNYNVQLTDGKTVNHVNTWITANITSFTAINPTTGANEATANTNTLTWTGLDYGYYYITSTLGSVVTINNVTPSANVADKNETNPSNLSKTSNSTTAQIGDEVVFTVTFTATNYITDTTTDDTTGKVTAETAQVTTYTVTDTMDGFDYKDSSLSVKVGDKTVTGITPTFTSQTDSATGSLSFTIDWDDQDGKPIYNYSETVTIQYTATVNEYAKDGSATNTVKVSNSTAKDELTGATTTTNTYNLTINKTDGTNALNGAKFELYRGDASTALSLIDITPASATNKQYRIAENGETDGVTTIDMSTVSSSVIYGLDGADAYKIKEIKAPEGYNILDTKTSHDMNNANGSETIVNNAGTVLPSTGGMGTTIFYILGSLMFIGAAVVLVTNKRMGREA